MSKLKRDQCPNCNRKKSIEVETCYKCAHTRPGSYANKEDREYLFEFISRIESRGGLASIQEIFVELITLNQIFGNTNDTSGYNVNKQLETMYKSLKNVRDKIIEGGFKIEPTSPEKVSTSRGFYLSKKGKYIASIQIDKKKIYLGSFENDEDAKFCYEKAKNKTCQ